MKRYLLIVALLPLLSKAQFDLGTINAKLTSQILNPEFYTLQVPIVSFDRAFRNSNAFAELGSDAKLGKWLAELKFRVNLLDNVSSYAENHSVYERQNSRSLKISLGYVFASKVRERKVAFKLNKGRESIVIKGIAKVQGTVVHAIKAGLISGFTAINGEGTKMVFNLIPGSSNLTTPNPDKTETVMGYKMLSIGYEYGYCGWWRVLVDGYGKKETNKYSSWYTNLLFMPEASLDDVAVFLYNTNDVDYYQQMSLMNTPLSRFGFVLGWQTIDMERFGFTARVEAGVYPGIQAHFITRAGASFHIGLNLGNIIGKSKATVHFNSLNGMRL